MIFPMRKPLTVHAFFVTNFLLHKCHQVENLACFKLLNFFACDLFIRHSVFVNQSIH